MATDERVYRTWQARKAARAKDGQNTSEAVMDVARMFQMSCAEVRAVIRTRRQGATR